MTTCAHTSIELLEPRQLLAAQWSSAIDNPYFPVLPGASWVYQGVVEGEKQRVRTTVTGDTKVIDGVTTTVVLDRVFIAGELAEKTYDYYAQDKAGNVWYFGEDTKEYEDGHVVSTDGSFLAGVNGANAGIIMLAKPGVGDEYRQEIAIGIAEDRAKVLSASAHAKAPFATYSNCVQTEDYTLLEPDTLEHKFYAPGIGILFSENIKGGQDTLKLVSYDLGPGPFQTTVDNPYFPLIPGVTSIFKGVVDGEPQKVRTAVTTDTKLVTGVQTTVVFDRTFINNKLSEKTYDYYAQDKTGNVWYFGEDTKEYENGHVVSTEGSFLAGVNNAKAGIIMPAVPGVGVAYHEESAVGVAEDEAKVIAEHVRIKTPFATFGDCLQTENFSVLEPATLEHKLYAAGFGVVFAEDVSGGEDTIKLVAIEYG